MIIAFSCVSLLHAALASSCLPSPTPTSPTSSFPHVTLRTKDVYYPKKHFSHSTKVFRKCEPNMRSSFLQFYTKYWIKIGTVVSVFLYVTVQKLNHVGYNVTWTAVTGRLIKRVHETSKHIQVQVVRERDNLGNAISHLCTFSRTNKIPTKRRPLNFLLTIYHLSPFPFNSPLTLPFPPSLFRSFLPPSPFPSPRPFSYSPSFPSIVYTLTSSVLWHPSPHLPSLFVLSFSPM